MKRQWKTGDYLKETITVEKTDKAIFVLFNVEFSGGNEQGQRIKLEFKQAQTLVKMLSNALKTKQARP